MPLPDLSSLPPWAIVLLVVSLAVIIVVGRFGFTNGKKTTAADASRTVELAMATIDPAAIRQVAAAIESVGVALAETNRIMREQGRDNSKALDEIAQEIRHQGESIRK